ncbi:Cyclin, N-terminal domain containing protein [Trichomonas vaginalis G3]|uniref:Cyclin, N-terminal domain containing protein n=1 Tax=Trichomonas vaginalis (strain ATCC PRA-98 / G3) TaxID=412133 RepID=A2FYZ2_TRIV3|nr:cyclin domain-containing protein [Trichomonas vaginalis G3]EAX89874.1 Cyclin, N-terminal domain containing protein [Trichomonas vaginalis G3]KAI5515313.1 cyclin domain-containing protein [Trichomonas vaginalis G3]|eukprot:XP_001302804.1 Cyclin, N-terminal domain containing protein [Trichomonas vaginalis G3]
MLPSSVHHSHTDFSSIHTTWSDEQRRTVWTLISKSRMGLKVELSPVIATAFIILQKYFRVNEYCPYKLFILMTAALFTSCKSQNCFRTIEMIYNELVRICKSAPSSMVRSLIGQENFDNQGLLSPEQIEEITQAEIDLLKALDFNVNFELPFTYFERWKSNIQALIPNENFIKICNGVIVDMCLVISSKYYLDIAPEVAAAAAAQDSIGQGNLSEITSVWINEVVQKYGQENFNLALSSIIHEKGKTFQRKSVPIQRPLQPIKQVIYA